MAPPNILLIMTDEERYPPPYESEAVRSFPRLGDWYADKGVEPNQFLGPAAESQWELHDLTTDAEERINRIAGEPDAASSMRTVLDEVRDVNRRIPVLRNPT